MMNDIEASDLECRKIVFVGEMGAGKTTAIRSISDTDPVSTEVDNVEGGGGGKLLTTVALDYGKVMIDEQTQLTLYGTPGQERFKFMWPILTQDALGLIVLISNNSEKPLEALRNYLLHFRETIEKSAAVVGITSADLNDSTTVEQYHAIVEKHCLKLPVFTIDARRQDDVLLLVNALLSVNEAKILAADH